MITAATVGVGGALGAAIRWAVSRSGPHPSGYPVGITLVNVVGSFVLGWIIGSGTEAIWSIETEAISAGLLGGLTTFSTWMVDADSASTNRMAAAIVAVPIALGVAAAGIGLLIGSVAS